MSRYTDLALEARELWKEEAGTTTELPGVRARETKSKGITTTVVEILSEEGVQALGKPCGIYVTLELSEGLLHTPGGFARAAACLGKSLQRLLPGPGPVLVAGLGNGAVTPDALGPGVLEYLLITRHLAGSFPHLRPVSALAPGVLGTTGLEAAELVKGAVERVQPCCVVAVDALASRSPGRVCSTIQLCNTGISPGSGVKNRRSCLDEATMGVPVIAVGVPTVVEANTLLEDCFMENKEEKGKIPDFYADNMVVTPRDIDARLQVLCKLLGQGLSQGLQERLSLEEIACLTGS